VETKVVRIFYDRANGEIVWYHELRGPGVFPTTASEDLLELPNKVTRYELDENVKLTVPVRLGGEVHDYACTEITEEDTINLFLSSIPKRVVEGKLVPVM